MCGVYTYAPVLTLACILTQSKHNTNGHYDHFALACLSAYTYSLVPRPLSSKFENHLNSNYALIQKMQAPLSPPRSRAKLNLSPPGVFAPCYAMLSCPSCYLEMNGNSSVLYYSNPASSDPVYLCLSSSFSFFSRTSQPIFTIHFLCLLKRGAHLDVRDGEPRVYVY